MQTFLMLYYRDGKCVQVLLSGFLWGDFECSVCILLLFSFRFVETRFYLTQQPLKLFSQGLKLLHFLLLPPLAAITGAHHHTWLRLLY